MATIILVPGAFHGAWCWQRLTPLLEARGFAVVAPDLPGTGADPTPPGTVTLDLWAGCVAQRIVAAAPPVLLVGHSRGGVVISRAAELLPERIAALIYLSGMLLRNGATILDGFAEILAARKELDTTGEPERAVIRAADGLTACCDPVAARRRFYSGTDAASCRFALDRLGVEPVRPWGEALRLTPARYGRVPRFYIECLRDRALPIALQRRMIARQPCRAVRTLDSDHSPFLSMPDPLAAALADFA